MNFAPLDLKAFQFVRMGQPLPVCPCCPSIAYTDTLLSLKPSGRLGRSQLGWKLGMTSVYMGPIAPPTWGALGLLESPVFQLGPFLFWMSLDTTSELPTLTVNGVVGERQEIASSVRSP